MTAAHASVVALAAGLALDTCYDLSRSTWTRARAAAHPSIARVASLLGIDRSHASRWESPKAEHPVPLAILWSRDAVPDAQLDAIVEQIRADRGEAVERALLSTPEGALRRVMKEANALLGRCIDILDDNRVSADERLAALRALDVMEAVIRRTRRALLAAERTGSR